MKNPVSSDLAPALALLEELRSSGRLLTGRRPAPVPVPAIVVPAQLVGPAIAPAAPARPAAPPTTKLNPSDGLYREERMRRLLADMCKRGGFSGAVLADGSGLPLADYNPPFDSDALAAYSSILGGALDQAGRLLGKRDANHLSLDLNYVDKIVIRRFRVGEQDCCLLVVCPQGTDERSDLELSIDEIITILTPST